MSNRSPFQHDEETLDRILLTTIQRDVFGASSLHILNPAEMAMRLEEFDPSDSDEGERWGLLNEIFNGFMEYLFAEGPAPESVRARIEGFLQSFDPDLAAEVKGEKAWVESEAVDSVLKKTKYKNHLQECQAAANSRGALSVWVKELESENNSLCVSHGLLALIRILTSQGKSWRILTAVAYCIAKSLKPHLIAAMSLHDIAILSGDNGGRATPSDRARRLINRRLADSGAKACSVHFQKSAETVEKYSVAQLGNNNRSKSKKAKITKHKRL